MRNLVSLQRRQWPLLRDADASYTTESSSSSLQHARAYTTFALHSDEPRGFFLRGDGRINSAVLDDASDHIEAAPAELFVDLRASIPPNDSDNSNVAAAGQWKWMSYIAELDALVCAHANGTLAVVDVATRAVDEIGTMDGGVRGIAWSSNQEMVAIVTGVGTILVMNAQWEVLHETQLDAFLPADVARYELRPQQSHHASADVAIQWRDDAQYLVLNVPVVRSTGITGTIDTITHQVLVFTSHLALHGVGRLEDGRPILQLGAALDWSPNQSLIASTEVRKDQLVVVFFERNGLRHGEFVLSTKWTATRFHVSQLSWNADSDVLAVALAASDTHESVVQLWTRDNYHWFLKHERRFNAANEQLVRVMWDAERAHVLHVLTRAVDGTSDAKLQQEVFVWDVASAERRVMNARNTESSSVVTGVIDGATLLLTPLHQALVPPPMALHQLSFAAPINAVAFDATNETLAALLSTGDVVVVDKFLESTPTTTTIARRSMRFSGHEDDEDDDAADVNWTSLDWMRLWALPTGGRALSLVGKSGSDDALVVATADLLQGDDDDAGVVKLTVQYPPALENVRRVTHVVASDNAQPLLIDNEQPQLSSTVAIQTHDGTVFTVALTCPRVAAADDDDAANECEPLELTDRCPAFAQLAVLATGSFTNSNSDSYVVLGLTTTSKLYVHDALLATACSTFRYCAFARVLLFTTLGSDAALQMLPRDALLRYKTLDDIHTIVQTRPIERGARLVAVVGDRAHVIVQLPRGNLECMAPRLLVLALAVALIRTRAFVAALEMSRKHRLDLNVLVDYDPLTFFTHVRAELIEAFVKTKPASVTSDRLCLFITSLHSVDVWRTKYKAQVAPFVTAQTDASDANDVNETSDKVNVVCCAVMQAICDTEAHDASAGSALLLPFVTAAVKQSPPQFAAALAKIQLLLQQHDRDSATRALKHLIVLAGVDKLFDEALGLYDLDLVRFVATYSQRDPTEYAPLLADFDRIAATAASNGDATMATSSELQFAIDVHLQRFERALNHVCELIRSAPDAATARAFEDAAVDVVTRGALHDQALALFALPPTAVPLKSNASDSAAAQFYARLTLLKAAHLEATQQFEAAAFVYLSQAQLDAAQRAFLAAGQWALGLSLALQTATAPADVKRLAYSVAQSLLQRLADMDASSTDANEADAVAATKATIVMDVARIYVEYCHDLDEAVTLLVLHCEYAEALRLARLHHRADLIESDVEPAVLAHAQAVAADIATRSATYVRHWTRLTTLREQKRLFKLHGIDGARWQRDGDNDTASQSDAYSVASGALSAADSARSNASMRSVGSHNSASRIGNFALQSLTHATSSHFFATGAATSPSMFSNSSEKPKKVRLTRNERRNKIKKGSVEEEQFVWQQCVASRPDAALQTHVCKLLQMLVLWTHVAHAQRLQTALCAFEQLVAVDKPLPPQFVGSDAAAVAATEPLAMATVAWRLAALRDE